MAKVFLAWLAVPVGSGWLDVGCGTGALNQTILDEVSPSAVKGIDRSEGAKLRAETNVKARIDLKTTIMKAEATVFWVESELP